MPPEPPAHEVRSSKIAAASLPAIAILSGLLLPNGSLGTILPPEALHFAAVLLVLAVGCTWLWLDARESKFELHPLHYLLLTFAPVVAVPYYFNQTRSKVVRLRSNAWFLAISLCTAIGYATGVWLGSIIK